MCAGQCGTPASVQLPHSGGHSRSSVTEQHSVNDEEEEELKSLFRGPDAHIFFGSNFSSSSLFFLLLGFGRPSSECDSRLLGAIVFFLLFLFVRLLFLSAAQPGPAQTTGDLAAHTKSRNERRDGQTNESLFGQQPVSLELCISQPNLPAARFSVVEPAANEQLTVTIAHTSTVEHTNWSRQKQFRRAAHVARC